MWTRIHMLYKLSSQTKFHVFGWIILFANSKTKRHTYLAQANGQTKRHTCLAQAVVSGTVSHFLWVYDFETNQLLKLSLPKSNINYLYCFWYFIITDIEFHVFRRIWVNQEYQLRSLAPWRNFAIHIPLKITKYGGPHPWCGTPHNNLRFPILSLKIRLIGPLKPGLHEQFSVI